MGSPRTSEIKVEVCRSAHLPFVAEILNREIEEGFAHFGTETVNVEELESGIGTRYPFFVATDGEKVLGFARAHPWKSRGGYAWTAEIGVYITGGFQGRGIGKLLVQQVIETCRDEGFHTLLAGIALPNDASIRLFESLGFIQCARLPQVGYKLGQWRDTAYWALILEPDESGPRPKSPTI